MGLTVNRYPVGGGTASARIITGAGGNKWYEFTISVNSGHKLTKIVYTAGDRGTTETENYSTSGPATEVYQPQFTIRNESAAFVLNLYFDGNRPGEDPSETYDFNVYTSVDLSAAGRAWSEPDVFEDMPLGSTCSYTLHAIANDGYVFDHWERDSSGANIGTSANLKRTFKSSDPGEFSISYTACFRNAVTYTFTAYASPSDGGTVNGLAVYTKNIEGGSTGTVEVLAVPAEGYAFRRWTKDGTTTHVSTSVLTRTINSSESWTAEFTQNLVRIPVKVIPSEYDHGKHGTVTITNRTTGEYSEFTSSGSFTAASTVTSGSPHAGISVSINTDDGCFLAKWKSKGTTQPSSSTSGSFTMYEGDEVRVYFGCGKIMYSYEVSKLIHAESDKLIYCG